jgi:2-polyprenyl-3-methyl-5-hydroxy-6-metoxy-1,4-benzoquinol methylase
MTRSREEAEAIAASWDANADAWTRVVREGRIPSRVAATDEAILRELSRRAPGPFLDVGCGEGWLARALEGQGFRVTAVDGSARLIALAREAGHSGSAEFLVATYEELVRDGGIAPGPFTAIALNFALLSDEIVPLLSALGDRLTPSGALVIQTVHPWVACGDATPYRDGWRTETFDALGGPFPSAMPWYFRTLASWIHAIREAGLDVLRLEEPAHPETGRPLSLLVTCVRAVAAPNATGR